MDSRIGSSVAIALLLAVAPAAAQTGPWKGSTRQGHAAAGVRQPARPGQATIGHRLAPPKEVAALFPLSPQQQADLDAVLNAWESRSSRVKTYECGFARWEYDNTFGTANKPKSIDHGVIKYAKPDKGMFEVKSGRREKWICDGKSIHAYDFSQKLHTQLMLPPEQQGKAIADGPLPFMFGAEAEKLKRRYFLRRVAPPKGRTDLICLEAYPRYQADAAQFSRIDLDLTANDLLPVGMQTYLPGRNGRFSFQFYNRKVNHFNPLEAIFGQGWFKASTPAGWRKDVKQPPQVQVSQQPPPRGNQPRRTVRR